MLHRRDLDKLAAVEPHAIPHGRQEVAGRHPEAAAIQCPTVGRAPSRLMTVAATIREIVAVDIDDGQQTTLPDHNATCMSRTPVHAAVLADALSGHAEVPLGHTRHRAQRRIHSVERLLECLTTRLGREPREELRVGADVNGHGPDQAVMARLPLLGSMAFAGQRADLREARMHTALELFECRGLAEVGEVLRVQANAVLHGPCDVGVAEFSLSGCEADTFRLHA
mmetsp:Transcript_59548/g.153349  ORF Transcript_59548/g.153349 Transcript_59548/m.153349 type:complete len:225 (+) Transcript_59548:368-1042(+)